MTRRILTRPLGDRRRRHLTRIDRDANGRRVTRARSQLLRIAASEGRQAIVELLDVSRSHLSEILSGEHRPGLDLACRIQRLLGIAVVEWYD